MNILTIDGGGIRGYFSAYLLERIQQELDVKFSEYFDLIAGTSTGSIIAAALAIDHPISEVWNDAHVLRDEGVGYDGYLEVAPARPCARDIRTSLFSTIT